MVYDRSIYDAIWARRGYIDLKPALKVCQVCSSGKQQEYLARYCRLRGDDLECTLNGFWVQQHGPAPLAAARNVLSGQGWLTLVGGPGTGKSFLLKAVVHQAVQQGLLAVYITLPELLDHLRRSYDPEAKVSHDGLWDNLLNCVVLAVDEADKYQATPWAEEKLFILADDRYRRWLQCGTLWAVNNLRSVPGYLQSRMADGRFAIVEMRGGDVRPELER
jgi:DNA replication protein DnaC